MAGRPIVVDTRKALAIVALVAAEGRPFARDELAAMFWPDADDEAARGALRRTLSALRTAVGDAGLVIGRTQVALDPDTASVDLAELERLAASSAPADLEAAAPLPVVRSWRASGSATARPLTIGRPPRRSGSSDSWVTSSNGLRPPDWPPATPSALWQRRADGSISIPSTSSGSAA